LKHGQFIEHIAELSNEQKEQILYKTALDWLGIQL